MAFFSEIKARLGLDISPFEKGLSQAQGSLGKVMDGAAGKLGNFKTLGTTIATALGLNLQTISEGLARMIVGFSKDQEAALEKLAARSAAVADEMEKRAKQRRGDDDPEVRVGNLQKDLETQRGIIQQNAPLTKEEKSARLSSAKTDEDKFRILFDIKKEEEERVKARADANAEISKINSEINTANDQIRAKSAALNKDTAKTEEEARIKILSIDEKIAEARRKIVEAAPAATGNKDIDDLKIAQQANDKAKARADLLDLEKEKQDLITAAIKETADIEEKVSQKALSRDKRIADLRAKLAKSALDVAKIEVPKIEVPKIEVPKIEAKIEAPKIEVPKLDTSGNRAMSEVEIAQQALETAKDRAELSDLEQQQEKEIEALAKDTAKVREDALNKTLTLEEQILAAKDKVNESELAAFESKAGIERANAELTLAQDRADLAELEREQSDKQAAAEKKRTDELDTQLKTLQDQKKTIEQTLAAQAKASLLPSMADVVSGKRNIGGVARDRATQLERDRAKVLELSDAEQRAREALAGASGPFAVQDALKSGRAIRAQLDQTRARITTNENLLGSRISDANPNAKMEEELMQIKTELRVLNYKTLAPENTK